MTIHIRHAMVKAESGKTDPVLGHSYWPSVWGKFREMSIDNVTSENSTSEISINELNSESISGSGADAFVKTLEQSSFFRQMGELKENLARVSSDLATIGDRATERSEEVETLAAHVMAIEAVLSVMLKDHPVDADAVRAEVVRRSEVLSGCPEGSPTVQAVARDIVGG